MSRLTLDLEKGTANLENKDLEQTVYDRKSIWRLRKFSIATHMKKADLVREFPIKIIGGVLTIERESLEVGVFYSLEHDDEELLIRKTVDDKIQIYEVLE